MTDDRDLSLILDSWLSDGPIEMPDRVIGAVAVGISRQRQRPAWRLDRRRDVMNTNVKIGAALIAVLSIAVVGYSLRPAGSTAGGPTLSAGPSPAPTGTASASGPPSTSPTAVIGGNFAGALAAGTYSTRPFNTAPELIVSMTVPDGWNAIGNWALTNSKGTRPPNGTAIGFFTASSVFSDPCRWDPTHGAVWPIPGDVRVGPTVDDLVAAFTAQSTYETTTPIDVAVGGHAGRQFELRMPDGLDPASCDETNYIAWSAYPDDSGLHAQGPGQRWQFRILDVDGKRVFVVLGTFAGTPASDLAEADAIIDSMTFSR
ncbi:MAG: hypothetical protein ACJ78H_14890 [Chloroflexota bacterium]